MPDPWVAIDATFRRNPKIAGLPSDSARYGWLVVLGEAKLLRRHGTFTRNQWRECAGRFWKFLPNYIAAGLIHEGRALCSEDVRDRCLEGRAEFVADNVLLVHDWPAHQREIVEPGTGSQTGKQRTANWRLRTAVFERDNYTCRYCANAEYPREWLILEHVIPSHRPESTTDMANLVTACRGCNFKKKGRTPEEAGMVLLPEPVTHHGDTSQERHEPVTSRALSSSSEGQSSGSPGEGSGGRVADLMALFSELTGLAYVPLRGTKQGDRLMRFVAKDGWEKVEQTARAAAADLGDLPELGQLVNTLDNYLHQPLGGGAKVIPMKSKGYGPDMEAVRNVGR